MRVVCGYCLPELRCPSATFRSAAMRPRPKTSAAQKARGRASTTPVHGDWAVRTLDGRAVPVPNAARASTAGSRPEVMFTLLGTSFHNPSTDPQEMATAYQARPGRGKLFFFAG